MNLKILLHKAKSLAKEPHDFVHKGGELARMNHTVAVGHTHAVGHKEAALGAREGNVELACVLAILLGVFVVGVGVAAIYGIKDHHVVIFEPFGLVNRCHIDVFADASAVAEVALLERIEVHHVALQLAVKAIGHLVARQDVEGDVAADVVELRYLVYLALGDEVAVGVL